jgi:hypothetical protein
LIIIDQVISLEENMTEKDFESEFSLLDSDLDLTFAEDGLGLGLGTWTGLGLGLGTTGLGLETIVLTDGHCRPTSCAVDQRVETTAGTII